ncbi:MAG: class II glutamine amidotransferase [Candidatus Bipolaricaulis anaerobius]|nr:class II glutamine amidotransferase [Candidatus Bipolaricaulis anaerobius]
MCRLVGALAGTPFPLRRYLLEDHGLLALSLRGAKAPHRDGVGWAYRDARGRMRLHRWGGGALAGNDGLPGDPSPETTLLIAHARKASPEYRAMRGAIHAHPLVRDGVFLAHNGTVRDTSSLGDGNGTDSQRILDWLVRTWHPRTPDRLVEALRELLGLIHDYTALNLLLTDGSSLYAFCCHTRDPDYYTLHRRGGDGAVVVASEPVDGRAGWEPMPNGTLLAVGPDGEARAYDVGRGDVPGLG